MLDKGEGVMYTLDMEVIHMTNAAQLLRAKLGVLTFDARQARIEAQARLRDNRRINDAEFAYSPSTGAVGLRWIVESPFRVFNVRYPMYGESKQVQDWVSVGKGKVS
jgi:hypothetical protein